MREDWDKQKLEDVLTKDSSSLSINKLKEDEGVFPFFGAKGLIKNISFYHQEKEYLAIIKDGAGVGRVSIHPAKSSVVGTLQYLIPKEGYDIKFLYYYLLSINFKKYFTGSTIPHIYFKDYKSEFCPKVSTTEQKEIVSILDDAFASIDKAKANIERNIENAKELFQSKLNEIFSQTGEDWKQRKILDLCEHKSQIVGGPFGSNLKVKDYKESGVPILRLQNIGKGYFIDKDIKYVSEEKAKELSYHSFKHSDIVLAKLGIPIGKTCIVPENIKYGIVVADVVRIRPNKNLVNYNFLKHFLNSDNAVRQLSSEIRGSTRPRVNIAEVRNLKLSVPKMEIQLHIAEYIENLEELRNKKIKLYEHKIKSLEELKKSILQKAFSGELTNKSVAA